MTCAVPSVEHSLFVPLVTHRKRFLLAGAALCAIVYTGFCLGTTEVKPQGMGGMTGPVRVRVFNNEKHLMLFYPLYLIERWCRNGSFFDASYHFNVDFRDKQYNRPWLYGDGKYSTVWYDLRGVVWFPHDNGSTERPLVNVAHDAPEAARHAVLNLRVRTPNHGTSGGTRALDDPVGSGSGSDGHFEEERLIAIKADGFEVLLTQGQDKTVQTATVFFPFGKSTEEKVLGCEVSGKYK